MKKRAGFTLVEILVVITIIGILVGLLLPAVQSARESGRKASCTNNLKQLGLGCKMHETSLGWFPTGGWNSLWAGDPDRGYDRRQPGGWYYNVLPYIGEQSLHDLGLGASSADTNKMNAILKRSQTPLPVFYCPTRRPAAAYPNASWPVNSAKPPATPTPAAARTDYAANGGSGGDLWWPGGSTTISAVPGTNDPTLADAATFMWPDMPNSTGVVFATSAITAPEITDGTGNTFLLGEKYVDGDHYRDGLDTGENSPAYNGAHWTSIRCTSGNCSGTGLPVNSVAGSVDYLPTQDRGGFRNAAGAALTGKFGSAHVGGLNFVMCDGAVRWIAFSVDPAIYISLGRRNDGVAIDSSKF